jgi:hypothetical protein
MSALTERAGTPGAFDDEVAEIVAKVAALPLFRRRDATAVSHALLILAARYAVEERGSQEDFVGSAEDAWKLESNPAQD